MHHNNAIMIDSKQLVPGDIILLEQSASSVVCDMVLLEGECVVSESSLTGESVPVVKLRNRTRQIENLNLNLNLNYLNLLNYLFNWI
jgi:P-type E1-E2 ATPase